MTTLVRLDVRVWQGDVAEAGHFSTIHRDAFAVGWSKSTFEIFLQERTSIGLLAGVRAKHTGDDQSASTPPAAFALLRRVGDEAELLSIAVETAQRRRGYGSALVYRMKEMLASQGVRQIFLEVGSRNSAALALYAEHGFAPVGQREGYYASVASAPADDAVVMKVELR